MADMNTLGVFKASSLITVGDEYVKKGSVDPRTRGRQLTTSPSKRGRLSDAYFDKSFRRLFDGEKHIEGDAHARREAIESRKKNLHSAPFRPSSPPQKSQGLGSPYGQIGKQFPHMKEHDATAGAKPRTHLAPRQIQTSPAKRGGYGVPNVTLGKEPPYMTDPYDAVKRKEHEERQAHMKNVHNAPFRAMSPCRKHQLDLDQKVYDDAGETKFPNRPKSESRKGVDRAFRPSSPSKTGYNGCFAPFPEYKFDPYDERIKREREAKMKARAPTVFKPTSGPKSVPVKSIAFGTL